jgi:Tfp pilus assembly protein FimT
MHHRTHERGIGLVELIIAAALAVIIVAMAVPAIISTRRNYRALGDARDVAAQILLAKMRAASDFTQTRVYFDTSANTFRLEIWDKTNNVWNIDNPTGTYNLSPGVILATGGQTNPPPNTQGAIGQASACMTGTAGPPPSPGGGTVISNTTACVVFNSRGIPVDNNGAATGNDAIYITDGANGLYASTVSATGLIQSWRIAVNDTNAAHWNKR